MDQTLQTNYSNFLLDYYKHLVKNVGTQNEDWSDALEYIFNIIKKNGGGSVSFLENSTYGFSRSVLCDDLNNIFILGGSNVILRKNTDFDKSKGIRLFNINYSSNIVIRDLKFIGESGADNSNWDDTIIMNYDASNVLIENCQFENTAIALNIGSDSEKNNETICSNIVIKNCRFNNVGQCYTTHPGGAENVTFKDNKGKDIEVMVKLSSRIKNEGYITIFNNYIENTKIGFDFVNTPNIYCYNNVIINAQEYGIQSESYENTQGTEHEGTSYDLSNWNIDNNTFEDCNIFVRITTDSTKVLDKLNISNNIFRDKNIENNNAIILTSNIKNVSIKNNIFDNLKLTNNSLFLINNTCARLMPGHNPFGEICDNKISNCEGKAFIYFEGNTEQLSDFVLKNNIEYDSNLAFIISEYSKIYNSGIINNDFSNSSNNKAMITGIYENVVFKNNNIKTASADILANIEAKSCSLINNVFSNTMNNGVAIRLGQSEGKTLFKDNNYYGESRLFNKYSYKDYIELQSPNGTKYKIKVSDNGQITATKENQ
ncbi:MULTISPECIES: hypothetical protein [unclassified Clostridium]|uniref:hypothetical protein n=1 Tax=unclassified Clostridium TaxID=2614128 RepID=UPI000298009F|nr:MULTISPECIES: hypothetical protein [unclassified Clostridium]EKQ56952.1 MAG: hypothetical protein A370_01448 [Clostridium sp. Maddingley MBC34-26]